ncbi:unnamed protein product [Tetraodon nigroviridis]|uniref:(spotted green pufferfish) hypothetical protein n=1 Tax=Tetraodon nigroviridis TaxID=99883 RepID=Q4RLJ1_TETNG|nr:unnamed protein product [Tetraodon nigroviridis]
MRRWQHVIQVVAAFYQCRMDGWTCSEISSN